MKSCAALFHLASSEHTWSVRKKNADHPVLVVHFGTTHAALGYQVYYRPVLGLLCLYRSAITLTSESIVQLTIPFSSRPVAIMIVEHFCSQIILQKSATVQYSGP